MARSRLMGQHGIHLSSCFGKGKANMPDLLRNLPGCHGQGQGYGPHQTWPLWGGEGCRTQNSENGIFSSLPPETSRCPRPQIPYREEGEIPLALPTTYLASCKFTVMLFLALTCIGVPSPLPPQPISSCSYLRDHPFPPREIKDLNPTSGAAYIIFKGYFRHHKEYSTWHSFLPPPLPHLSP